MYVLIYIKYELVYHQSPVRIRSSFRHPIWDLCFRSEDLNPRFSVIFPPMIWIFMESEEPEIKWKQASKRDRTLPNIMTPLIRVIVFLAVICTNIIWSGELHYSFLFLRHIPIATVIPCRIVPSCVAKVVVIS